MAFALRGSVSGTALVFGSNFSPRSVTMSIVSAFSLALIRALKTDSTLTGRQSTATLKVPGTDAMPSGASYNSGNGNITVTGTGVTFEDWDFSNCTLTINSGADVTKITQSIFDGQRGFYDIQCNAGSRVREVSWNTFDGGDSNATLWLRGDEMPDLIEHNRCLNGWDDYIKPGNNTDVTAVVQLNYFGPAKHAPNAKAAWNSGTTYSADEWVHDGNNGKSNEYYQSQVNGNLNNTIPTGSGVGGGDSNWVRVDPHFDTVQWYNAVDNNSTFRWNYFDCESNDYNAGVTSCIFLDGGSGNFGNGDCHMYENIFDMADNTAAGGEVPQSIRVAGGGTGEAFLYRNWMRTAFKHLNNFGNTNLGTNWEFDGTNTHGSVILSTDGDITNTGTITDYTGTEPTLGANWTGY